ncbi:MAG: helix-turn-helix transcriptional regulator [Saprospiraceae bacterium]|nr:helix-turn-helix transcriptional regulator [Saprospiraceae bacterium]
MKVTSREYPVSPILKPYVECYWSQESDGTPQEYSSMQRCLPLGMSELIFQVGEIHQLGIVDEDGNPFPKAYIEGMMDESVLWQMPGASSIFGARLKPEGLIQLFRRPLAYFFNNFVLVEDFFGYDSKILIENIQNAATHRERIAILEYFLISQLKQSKPKHNYFTEAMKKIRSSNGNISIETLSKTLYVCERQLQRAFKVNLGLSPKTYQRIIRFSNTYNSILQREELNWAELAQQYDYADQAHFIRDFKQFAGATPNVVLNEIISKAKPVLSY